MYKKILVPLDFSSANENTLAKAQKFKEKLDAEVVLVHAIDYLPPSYVQIEIPEIYTSKDLMMERAKKHVDGLALKQNLSDSDVIVRVGHAKDVVLSICEEHEPDLVIMAKHAHSGLERLLGSTTNGVLHHVKCEVLVIPVD